MVVCWVIQLCRVKHILYHCKSKCVYFLALTLVQQALQLCVWTESQKNKPLPKLNSLHFWASCQMVLFRQGNAMRYRGPVRLRREVWYSCFKDYSWLSLWKGENCRSVNVEKERGAWLNLSPKSVQVFKLWT